MEDRAADQLGAARSAVSRGSLALLVVDASVAVPSCWKDDGFAVFAGETLAAPPLMWSETRSALHEGVWRGDLDRSGARAALDRLERSPVEPVTYPNLGADAWDLADLFGCAKTYDAEYLALARHLRCLVVTLDERLRRGAERLGLVVGPNEL